MCAQHQRDRRVQGTQQTQLSPRLEGIAPNAVMNYDTGER